MRSGQFFRCLFGDSFVEAKVKQETEGEEKRERGKEETHFTAISFTLYELRLTRKTACYASYDYSQLWGWH